MSTSRNLKRALIVALAAVLSVLCLGVLAGCGPNSEEVIRSSITEEFDAYKNLDDAKFSEIAEKAEMEDLSQLGINGSDFATAILDGFDYNIDSVVVNDKAAQAKVTIVSKSYSEFEDKLKNAVEELRADPAFADMSSDEMRDALGQRVMQIFDEVGTKSETVTLDYQLEDKEWKPINKTEALGQLDSLVFAS